MMNALKLLLFFASQPWASTVNKQTSICEKIPEHNLALSDPNGNRNGLGRKNIFSSEQNKREGDLSPFT